MARYLDNSECRQGFADLTRKWVVALIGEAEGIPGWTHRERVEQVERLAIGHIRDTVPCQGRDDWEAEVMVSDCQAALAECLADWRDREGSG